MSEFMHSHSPSAISPHARVTRRPRPQVAALLALGCALSVAPPVRAATATDPSLAAAIANPARTAAFAARDVARHPAEALTFFGIAPTKTVV